MAEKLSGNSLSVSSPQLFLRTAHMRFDLRQIWRTGAYTLLPVSSQHCWMSIRVKAFFMRSRKSSTQAAQMRPRPTSTKLKLPLSKLKCRSCYRKWLSHAFLGSHSAATRSLGLPRW